MSAPRPTRHALWGAAWALLIFLTIEVGALRSGWFWETIEDSPAFNELPSENLPPHALVRALALRARARRAGGYPDTVLVVGSSVAAYGVDSAAMSAALGRPARVVWEAGADFPLVAALTEFLVREVKPSVVVLAASPHQALEAYEPADLARRKLYRLSPSATLAQWSTACAQSVCHSYRFRGPMRQFAGLWWQRITAEWSGTPSSPPLFEFTPVNAPDLWSERRAWERTGQVEHYWRSMERIVAGQPAMARFAADFRTRFRTRPGPQWTALERWIVAVRAAGAEPVIALFPLNRIVTQEDFSAVALEKPRYPIVPREAVTQFTIDLQDLVSEYDVPLWNQVDALGPEAFYDHHHLMPGPRRAFSLALGTWVRQVLTASGNRTRLGHQNEATVADDSGV